MSNPAAPSTTSDTSSRRFYHSTRADLKPGDLIQPGYSSNYTERRSSWIYFSETLHAATWGAELAQGEGPGRIYLVEPTGSFMDDPNLTDRKYPGNPTKSYRSREPLRVVGEYLGWQGHSPLLAGLVVSLGITSDLCAQAATWVPLPAPPLTIGHEGDPDYESLSIAAAYRLPGGDIVVADWRTPFLRVLDQKGQLLRTLGREGAGPGEFRSVYNLLVAGDTPVPDRSSISL